MNGTPRDRFSMKALVRWLVVLVTVVVVGGQVSLADADIGHDPGGTFAGHEDDRHDTHRDSDCFFSSCPQMGPADATVKPDLASRGHRPFASNRGPVPARAPAPDPQPPKPLG
jgi:hypothetical protein